MGLLLWLAIFAAFLVDTAIAYIAPIAFDSYAVQLDYRPDSTNTSGNGPSWNASFAGSPWSQRVGPDIDQLGVGRGFHWAYPGPPALAEVEVVITFYGTGIEFFGHFAEITGHNSFQTVPGVGSSVRMSIDGTGSNSDTTAVWLPPESNGRIAFARELPVDKYTVGLRVLTGVISLTGCTVYMEVGGNSTEVTRAQASPLVTYPWILERNNSVSLNRSFGAFSGAKGGSGSWAGQSNGDGNAPRAGSNARGDTLSFVIPRGAGFMSLNGTSNSNHGMFRITFDPAPPSSDEMFAKWTFTYWQVLDSTLFAVGLDPKEEYVVTLENIHYDGREDPAQQWFDVRSLTLWTLPNFNASQSRIPFGRTTTPAARTTGGRDVETQGTGSMGSWGGNGTVAHGTIAGAVIGGVAGLAALIAAVFFLLQKGKRRNRGQHPPSPHDLFYVDAIPESGAPTSNTAHLPQPVAVVGAHKPGTLRPPVHTEYAPVPTDDGARALSWASSSSSQPRTSFGAALSDVSSALPGHSVISTVPYPSGDAAAGGQGHHLAHDGGPLPADDMMPRGEMPPTYDAAWSGADGSSARSPGSSLPQGVATAPSRSAMSSSGGATNFEDETKGRGQVGEPGV